MFNNFKSKIENPLGKSEGNENPEILKSEIEGLKVKQGDLIKKLNSLVLYGGIVLSAFAMEACKHQPTEKEKIEFSKDSLNNVIQEREKTNGVQKLSTETLSELNQITKKLMELNPGDSIGHSKAKFLGETVTVEEVSGKLGNETGKDTISQFSYFLDPKDSTLRIICMSDGKKLSWGNLVDMSEKTVFVSKRYDKDGTILSEYWEANSSRPVNGVGNAGYSINYNREAGTFSEMLAPFLTENDKEVILIGGGAFSKIYKQKPPRFKDESFSIGGSPEHFFQKAIEAFKQAEKK